jgi:hypothetical protein
MVGTLSHAQARRGEMGDDQIKDNNIRNSVMRHIPPTGPTFLHFSCSTKSSSFKTPDPRQQNPQPESDTLSALRIVRVLTTLRLWVWIGFLKGRRIRRKRKMKEGRSWLIFGLRALPTCTVDLK